MKRRPTLQRSLLPLLFCLALSSVGGSATASDPNKAHANQGLLKPFTSAPAAQTLSASDLAKLKKGDFIQRHSEGDGGGSGVAVQYIKASPEVIWSTILNYSQYKNRVKNVKSCSVYKRSGDDIYVDMQSSVFGFGFGLYTRNTVKKDQGYMAWTLDYDRKSDVEDMVGYWRLESIQVSPPITKLEYSTQIKMRGVPGFIVNYLTKDSLREGTAWVKLHSEKAAGTD
mgnify:CR=1 FL=1